MQQPVGDKEELLKRIEERAIFFEKTYHGCSQCTLLAIQENLNLTDEGAFKAATPLVGGVALMGDTCGAVIGGLMAIGLVFGRSKIEDGEALSKCLRPARMFYRRFQQQYGSCICRDLQKIALGRSFDMTKKEDYEAFRAAGAYEKCAVFAGGAARIAADLILRKEA